MSVETFEKTSENLEHQIYWGHASSSTAIVPTNQCQILLVVVGFFYYHYLLDLFEPLQDRSSPGVNQFNKDLVSGPGSAYSFYSGQPAVKPQPHWNIIRLATHSTVVILALRAELKRRTYLLIQSHYCILIHIPWCLCCPWQLQPWIQHTAFQDLSQI